MELKELLCLLEERLVEHDNSRKEVQNKLQEVCSKLVEEADSLEEEINQKLQESFEPINERFLSLIEKFNNQEETRDDNELLIKQAREELANSVKFEIQYSSKLAIIKEKNELNIEDENVNEEIISKLQECLNKIYESMIAAQDKLAEICTNRRNYAKELEERINKELESLFLQEDTRIQGTVKMLKEESDDDKENIEEMILSNRSKFLLSQKYSLDKNYNLLVRKEPSMKLIIESRKPLNVTATLTKKLNLSLSFTFFSDDETKVLKEIGLTFNARIRVWKKVNEKIIQKHFRKKYIFGEELIFLDESFKPNTTYFVRMRIERLNKSSSQWSEDVEFTTPEFSVCSWKGHGRYVDEKGKYFECKNNSKIATKKYFSYWYTITGNMSLPLNKVTSWSIKIKKSIFNNGDDIFIGVAPSDINQNEDHNYKKCGWYFNCYRSSLYSGPPHNEYYKEYGPRKERGEYVHNGDSVGVIMDTTNGELSFVLNDVNYGVAFEGIPLDKPLVPCVILYNEGDSVELDTSKVKESVGDSISAPSNIITKSSTRDSITLAWDAVEGASFYQIEVDGSKLWDVSTTNVFTKIGLLEEAVHSFRVRIVKGNKVSEWSDVVKRKTLEIPDFSKCVWKECPDNVENKRKYSVDENNSRIATNTGGNCTIIGNTSIPLNNVSSWNIKILKSEYNNGYNIYVGVAPSDINQNKDNNFEKCGWYLNCFSSSLISGPPHYYKDEEYGPRENVGEYVHKGDSVGVVMDTINGDLSFIVKRVNLGIAFEGIPLDKPLVPCVILYNKGDSVELLI